jgi:hypothetical protein
MASVTVTYSPPSNGWTSFWSFYPDWMLGMNNSFYSWKNGSLYKHDVNNIRNQFYLQDVPSQSGNNVNYPSTVTTIFNQDPIDVKMYKTLHYNSNTSWDANIITDLDTGMVDASYFQEREGQWYAYIRRADNGSYDAKLLSTQGVGSLQSYSSLVLTFAFNIGNNISNNDKVYRAVGGTLVLLGTVASHTSNTITLTSLVGPTPTPGSMIVYTKNAQAESFGIRGYYMEVELSNIETTEIELFAVSANAFKSYPSGV